MDGNDHTVSENALRDGDGACQMGVQEVLRAEAAQAEPGAGEPSARQGMPGDAGTDEVIRRLSYSNPTIHACLAMWLRGQVTYQKAVEIALATLVEQNEALVKMVTALENCKQIVIMADGRRELR